MAFDYKTINDIHEVLIKKSNNVSHLLKYDMCQIRKIVEKSSINWFVNI